jgi:trk system potassium uptake protein TrkA
MRVIIIGSGRVGARTAGELDRLGHKVTIIDTDQEGFDRLPVNFAGNAVRGSGTDEDVLRDAGAEGAELLMALTEGDNRNALSAQLGKHQFGIPRVIAKINDPLRAEAFRSLGVETICRTVILSDSLVTAAIEGAEATDGNVLPPTAEPLRGAPLAGSPAHAVAQEAIERDAAQRPQTATVDVLDERGARDRAVDSEEA